jgi:hypothetical protein
MTVTLAKHRATRAYGGVEVYLRTFLTSTLVDGCGLLDPGCFIPAVRIHDVLRAGVIRRTALERFDLFICVKFNTVSVVKITYMTVQ